VSSGREWRKKKNDENLWSLDLETGAWSLELGPGPAGWLDLESGGRKKMKKKKV
jgi:hypothetical protein